MHGVRALVVTVAMATAAPASYAHGGGHGGGHAGGGAGFGHGMRAAPGLTPQGRFVHGPAFGHPSFVGRPHFANRVVIGGPLLIPGYYGTPLYATPFPDPYAVPPVAYDPPPVSYVPPPVTYTPPPVAYAPPPVTHVVPPQASVPPTRLASGPPTPIYFCAELHAYTNDLKSMDCPGHWRRMTY
jgi:hypothetical protein